MDIVFERGNAAEPKGHALLYFKSTADPSEIWATYMVILPISVDISKYVPPFLMNQVKDLGPKDLSAFAFPPAPERLASREVLDDLAARRDDDVLFGGDFDPTDVAGAMMSVNEIVQRYSEVSSDLVETKAVGDDEPEDPDGLGVSDVLYGLMSEGDRLGELTKLVGKLRFGVEGSDAVAIKEAEREIEMLAGHLPANHNATRLVEAVKSTGERATELAELYLRRCYHLVHEEYLELHRIEERIRALEAEPSPDAS